MIISIFILCRERIATGHRWHSYDFTPMSMVREDLLIETKLDSSLAHQPSIGVTRTKREHAIGKTSSRIISEILFSHIPKFPSQLSHNMRHLICQFKSSLNIVSFVCSNLNNNHNERDFIYFFLLNSKLHM